MTTQLVRDIMKLVAEGGVDPVEMHWFDATGCFNNQDSTSAMPLLENRPPFNKCMVCFQGKSSNYDQIRVWMLVAGEDPEEGVVLTVWRQVANHRPSACPIMVYAIDEGQIRYGAANEDETIDKTEAEMILGFLSSWYESLVQRTNAYVPSVAQTFTNKRKIAQGKLPTYDWTTVVVTATPPKAEPKGGTHASPRLHDRRGHLRRLRSGKNVWVKPHKVGDATIGTIFHDYRIGE